jgi:NAD-dependent DNA ligase
MDIAYKFPQDSRYKVLSIKTQVGRTGALLHCSLEPVNLPSYDIKRSLHNFEEIEAYLNTETKSL